MRIGMFILAIALASAGSKAFAQDSKEITPLRGSITSFPIVENHMAIGRPARQFTPFDKVGRRFAVLGYESGTFEAWAYPLKLFRNFEFSFYLENSTRPINAADIAREVKVTPEATTITYVYQSFTVKAVFVTAVDEPGAMILLEVDSLVPLKIVCGFLPVLQPMWPAGLGGQYAYWDDDLKAYVIDEATGQNHGIVGSPAANGISYTPAHMLSDYPNEFTIEIKDPASVRGRFVPIYIAGGKGKWESVKAVYDSLKSDPEKHYLESVNHFKEVEDNTLKLTTPLSEINLAFEWAKVAYDNLVVNNPDLGKGIVAGLGMSGTGGRPGFGWFFGGDAFINSFSLNSYCAFSTVRDVLAFTEKWQRSDGKMAHELSQAAGYVDWFKNYGYGYIHADTTPFYIDAMYDYYKMTGDREFILRSWESLKKAYDWCLTTDSNNDGLMDNSKAGLGALEFGSLIGIESDVYLSAIWVRATHAMAQLAQVVGDETYFKNASSENSRAADSYEKKFWNQSRGFYAYAFNSKGEQVDELSPWMAVGLAWDIGSRDHDDLALERLASSELTTDWGVRSISARSKYYDPLNYNYGTVWPFITGWAAAAEFEHRFSLQGYELVLASVRHTFDNEAGDVTEVFSGATNTWLGEAVSHQGFSTAGAVLPLVRGLFGLDGSVIDSTVTFAPQFPADWDSASASDFKIGNASFSFDYHKTMSKVTIAVNKKNARGFFIKIAPVFGPGTVIDSVMVNGKREKYDPSNFNEGVEPSIELRMSEENNKVEFAYRRTVEILPPNPHTWTGASDEGLKIISVIRNGKELRVNAQGLSGKSYEVCITNQDLVESVTGAAIDQNVLSVTVPGKQGSGFIDCEFSIRVKQ